MQDWYADQREWAHNGSLLSILSSRFVSARSISVLPYPPHHRGWLSCVAAWLTALGKVLIFKCATSFFLVGQSRVRHLGAFQKWFLQTKTRSSAFIARLNCTLLLWETNGNRCEMKDEVQEEKKGRLWNRNITADPAVWELKNPWQWHWEQARYNWI